MAGLLPFLRLYKRQLGVLIIPCILLPLPVIYNSQVGRCAFALLVTGSYWCLDIMPLAVTSLVPIILMPTLGLLTTKEVCAVYFKDTVMVMFGNMTLSLALQSSRFHIRIALWFVVKIGTMPSRLMVALMIPSWFISMWMPSAACIMMVLPILEGIIDQLHQGHLDAVSKKEAGADHCDVSYVNTHAVQNGKVSEPENIEMTSVQRPDTDTRQEHSEELKKFSSAMTLAIAYAAKAGGIACITGTTANIVMKGYSDDLWMKNEGNESPVTFSSWMLLCSPLSIMVLIIICPWLHILFFRGSRLRFNDPVQQKKLREKCEADYRALGPVRFEEYLVAALYVLLISLWFFRQPTFMTGWAAIFDAGYIRAAVPTLAVVLLAFLIPTKRKPSKDGTVTTLLSWEMVSTQLPWGILLLLGGGHALALACDHSGLSALLASQLSKLLTMPAWAMMLLIGLLTSYMTEVLSNSALVAIMGPIVGKLSQQAGKNPLYLVFPMTLCADFAFMLPISSASSAAAFSFGRTTNFDMMRAGVLLNLIGALLTVMGTTLWGGAVFDLHNDPWPQELVNSSSLMSITESVI